MLITASKGYTTQPCGTREDSYDNPELDFGKINSRL